MLLIFRLVRKSNKVGGLGSWTLTSYHSRLFLVYLNIKMIKKTKTRKRPKMTRNQVWNELEVNLLKHYSSQPKIMFANIPKCLVSRIGRKVSAQG